LAVCNCAGGGAGRDKVEDEGDGGEELEEEEEDFEGFFALCFEDNLDDIFDEIDEEIVEDIVERDLGIMDETEDEEMEVDDDFTGNEPSFE